MDSLYIVMPAYNEEGNIEKTIKEWYGILDGKDEKSRLIIADKGSKDRTHEIILELKKEYPKLETLDTESQYHGPKVIALYDYALKNNIDYIFQTDSDGQTNPDEFDAFWNMRNEYDAIIGNRTVRGDGEDRAFVEKVVCLLLKLYFGVKVPDANAPFRLMKSDVLKRHLYRLPSDFDLSNIMLTAYFAYYKEKITFREISFKPRTAGVNSLDMPKIVKKGWKALGDFYKLRKEMSKNSIK